MCWFKSILLNSVGQYQQVVSQLVDIKSPVKTFIPEIHPAPAVPAKSVECDYDSLLCSITNT